ncbi:NDP-hexose 2,3-dehydratase family protein [Shewanella kaireitica]|uniref:NDP-hexose 2,3-dehydratase family protein n=1 Tax=Shewanella kaireitica TaxID=212021 RepID=UPI00200E8ADB|nr:NDP-hexose 2,3-dehydratase family protein [Shewanella kaireitica]MCL1093803.1 NDP-hexose 2,3-dehydratase family protein [Shewanella kaireitica]
MNFKNDIDRLLMSSLTIKGSQISCLDALIWIEQRKKEVHVNIEKTKLSQLDLWKVNKEAGHVEHHSGGFFRIEGLDVHIRKIDGDEKKWNQPIINQPEIGFLGCIVKEIDGILHFLVQAKIEPGNANVVQLSPTLQATRSNYTQRHNGKKPKYLDLFLNKNKSKVLLDTLQSEQGARFLRKRNRNIIIEIKENIEESNDYKWLTLGQIKYLTRYDSIVNMDLRTVISCIPFHQTTEKNFTSDKVINQGNEFLSCLYNEYSYERGEDLQSWLTGMKSITDLYVKKKPIGQLDGWELNEEALSHKDGLYFDVLWVSVEIMHREVAKWDQPILAPRGQGVIAFIVKRINGILHFLVQAEIESGNFDLYEFGPTVSCVPSNHENQKVPFLDYVLAADKEMILFDALQSEEGGRFYHEENRNIIVLADDDFSTDVPNNFKWFTLRQLLQFNMYNNYLNIGARSLISSIQFLSTK